MQPNLATLTLAGAVALAAPVALAHDAKPAPQDKPAAADRQHGAQPDDHRHGADIGEPGDPKQVIRTFRISAGDDNKFRPAAVIVRQGETIRIVLKNEGKLKHELMLGTKAELKEHAAVMVKHPEMEHDDPNAITVQPGETRELVWKFTKVGEVDFACLVPGHLEGGMVGKDIVNR